MPANPPYRIGVVAPEARRFIERADGKTRRNVARHFEAIETDPIRGKKHLKGIALCNRQARFGMFRIEYTINQANVIDVLTIAPRKDRWRRSSR